MWQKAHHYCWTLALVDSSCVQKLFPVYLHIKNVPTPPLARQHLGYGDCLEVKREYYHNSYVLDCMTQCLKSAAHLHEQSLQVQQINRLGLSNWDSYTVCRGGCLELYYCNMVEWFWCFDTVGLVIWPVTTVPEMTYNVFSGTLSLHTN